LTSKSLFSRISITKERQAGGLHLGDDIYLIWLSRIDGIGIKKIDILLGAFGSAENVFRAQKLDFAELKGVTAVNVETILASQKKEILERYYYELKKLNIKYVSKFNENYPKELLKISDPPVGLYVLGEIPKSEFALGVVGSRRCTGYGVSIAEKFSYDLAKKNVTIISGMARGIDSFALKGALAAGGKTIAVLGCGVDICYPPENKALREKVISSGAVVSEYPPNTPPLPAYFPIRNRIISGISKGVLIVEAGYKSGAIITATCAADQGREIFAVPGNITSEYSAGSNALIKDGAIPVTTPNDIIGTIGVVYKDEKNNNIYTKRELLSPEEQNVFEMISDEPINFEELTAKSKSDLNELSCLLTELELKGYINKLAGSRYIRV
jgi:DNA processing protein